MKHLLVYMFLLFSLVGYSQTSNKKNSKKINDDPCTGTCCTKDLTCKLTTPEIQERKRTVIVNLKRQVIKKKELKNGFSYTFKGGDAMVDELTSFIKTERLCCDFFDFALTVKGDSSFATLSITGPKGVKDFIKDELEF